MSAEVSLRTRRTRLIVGGVLGAAVLAPVTWAFASFFGSGSTSAQATADVLSAPATPVVTRATRSAIITWTAATTSDDVAATSYSVERRPSGGGTSSPVVCLNSLPFQCTDLGVPTGTWEYRVTAHLVSWDSAPSASATVNIPAPTFTITPGQTVRTGASVLGGTFTNFQAGELVTVTASPGGAVIGQVPADTSGTGAVALTAGAIGGTFTATATGASGASATSPIPYNIDAVAPTTTATVNGTFGGGGFYFGVLPTVTLTPSEAGVTTYELNGAPTATYSGPSGLIDGTNTVTFRTVDLAGNIEPPQTLTVKVDVRAPNPGVLLPLVPYLTTPIPLPLTVTSASDPSGSGVSSVQYVYCINPCTSDVVIGSSSVAPNFVLPWTPPATDGVYVVRAIVSDVAGNKATSSTQTITVDNVVPTGTLTTPTEGSTIGLTFPVTVVATDATSGVANVQLKYRAGTGGPFSTLALAHVGTTTTYSASPNTLTLANGTYQVQLVVTDKAGNAFTQAAPTTLTIQNWSAQSLSITNGASSVSGTLDAGDSVVLTFTQPPAPASICAAWDGTPKTGNVVVTNGAVNDVVTFTSTGCTGNIGGLAIDKAYLAGTNNSAATFGASTFQLTGTQLTVTFGGTPALTAGASLASGPVLSPGIATYSASAALTSSGVGINSAPKPTVAANSAQF